MLIITDAIYISIHNKNKFNIKYKASRQGKTCFKKGLKTDEMGRAGLCDLGSSKGSDQVLKG